MSVTCCKCGRRTRRFTCRCGHRVCTSCKSPWRSTEPVTVLRSEATMGDLGIPEGTVIRTIGIP